MLSDFVHKLFQFHMCNKTRVGGVLIQKFMQKKNKSETTNELKNKKQKFPSCRFRLSSWKHCQFYNK